MASKTVSQSNRIFAFMALAFVVFITMKGELPVYLGFILSTPKQAGNGNGATTDVGAASDAYTNKTLADAGDLLKTGFKLAAMI